MSRFEELIRFVDRSASVLTHSIIMTSFLGDGKQFFAEKDG
jgi:hypothetical protein